MEEGVFDTELGRKILALTKASFRVSDLISDLVFREKIKHQILTVFEKSLFIYGKQNPIQDLEKSCIEIIKEIDILDHYFYLGGHLNLVKEEHLKALRNGFLVFKSQIVLSMNESSKPDTNSLMSPLADDRLKVEPFEDSSASENVGSSVSNILNAKQRKILEKFENKDTLKLAEILYIFPNISEKTVRNELANLINLGKITRSGMGNGSFYKVIK